MKCHSVYQSIMILSVLLCFSLLYLTGDFYGSEKYGKDEYVQGTRYAPKLTVEHVSSNDFSLTHKNGRDENIQHTFVTTFQSDKVLRECIYDLERILIVANSLTWFTHQTYQVSIPPQWHPSIPIAHRKLII